MSDKELWILAERAARLIPRHRARYTGIGPEDGLEEAAQIIYDIFKQATLLEQAKIAANSGILFIQI